jgi:hypothetical protein
MPDTECPPAGFESHWDAPWFQRKSDECQRLASLVAEQHLRDAMLDLATDFKKQSEHAALLAAVAFGRKLE